MYVVFPHSCMLYFHAVVCCNIVHVIMYIVQLSHLYFCLVVCCISAQLYFRTVVCCISMQLYVVIMYIVQVTCISAQLYVVFAQQRCTVFQHKQVCGPSAKNSTKPSDYIMSNTGPPCHFLASQDAQEMM